MGQFSNYYDYVSNEAENFVDEYIDSLIENVEQGNTNVDEFIDDYRLHEWCDSDFIYVDLVDSTEVLEQSNNVETDSGLWEGQEPKDAIQTQAFFTYRNDMYHEIKEQMEEKLNEKISELEEELEEFNERVEALELLEDEDELSENQENKLSELRDEVDDIKNFISSLNEAVSRI